MNNNDERDYAEEAANRALMEEENSSEMYTVYFCEKHGKKTIDTEHASTHIADDTECF